jgi:mannose-6-phosphate isomerase-like protein (cupin superfamily)
MPPWPSNNRKIDAMTVFPTNPIVLAAADGRQILGPTGQPMLVKADKTITAGAYALIEYSHAAGAPGPPAHIHREHEEAFYVIDGELTLLLGDETVSVEVGGFAIVPRGVKHSPSNTGAVPVRFFFITSPPMEDFFIEMGDLMAATNGKPTPSQLRDIGERHDSFFVDLPTDGPVAMYNEIGAQP